MHLDLTVSDLEAACRRAASLGATVLSDLVEEPGCVYVVHADPAGHPFCLCQER
jgi:predicted enzyme related to lactoylglutathione lyase